MTAQNPTVEHDFTGATIESTSYAGVRYKVRSALGEGAMGTAYFALRETGTGTAPAVLKVLHPSVVLSSPEAASLVMRKEAVALGRLNEVVPPNPFVVRLFETGTIEHELPTSAVEIPWLALEYVHGGPDGTTLRERVESQIEKAGHAFDMDRAHLAIESMTGGLSAVHGVGVVHRDMKPGNVLCCGFGRGELFKIADFGIARPMGMETTFGETMLGTPGYAAPEQCFPDHGAAGPWTDVFSFAATVFFLLTGEEYFETSNPAHALMLTNATERRKLADAEGLSPQLRALGPALESIDLALARATSSDPGRRPPSAELFAAGVLDALSIGPASVSASVPLPLELEKPREPSTGPLTWTVHPAPSEALDIRRAVWSSDGSCLALTSSGLEFWDGSAWLSCGALGAIDASALRFVQSSGPGSWTLGGEGSALLIFRTGGVVTLIEPVDHDLSFSASSGDADDLLLLAANRTDGPPVLVGMSARRWVKPFELEHAASISDLCRLSDTTWLVCGALNDGRGFAAIYDPLMWRVIETHVASCPLVACSSPGTGMALGVGTLGEAIRVTDAGATHEPRAGCDLWSVAIDRRLRGWAGAVGGIWTQPTPGMAWERAWADPSWPLAFTAVHANETRVLALSRDGGVVEGRSE